MADLDNDQIAAWERWFENLDPIVREGRPVGFYALTDMARKHLRRSAAPEEGLITEPTEAMIEAGMEASVRGRPSVDDDAYVLSIYRAMISAAPAPAGRRPDVALPVTESTACGAVPGSPTTDLDGRLKPHRDST